MSLVLLVDDSIFQRTVVREAVKAGGYQTVEAENGIKGLEMIETEKPDCVVLDLVMPEMGGIEVLEKLRSNGSKVPVIVLTADIQKTSSKQCIELGAVAVLNKPVDNEELIAELKKYAGATVRG